MMAAKYKRLLYLCVIFSIAMAYLESTVVVYLRELFYPQGFQFPLKQIPPAIYFTEIGREISTIIMLWGVAGLIAKNTREWFAFFAFNFGIWDIWYYIWLKILLNWPASIMEWDVLFLIPVPWLSPVLAPVLVSILLIAAAILILNRESRNLPILFRIQDWLVESVCGLIIILSFVLPLSDVVKTDQPDDFYWWLFLIGLLAGFLYFLIRSKKTMIKT